MSLILLDIGTGTQDILVLSGRETPERSPKMVLPSPTVVKAGQIARATAHGRAVFLEGVVMGGGPVVRAVRAHQARGLPVYASPQAALTLHDSLDRVRAMGVRIVERPPEDADRIETTDFMERELRGALELFSIALPEHRAFAVQDHGFSPEKSNRVFRFELMRRRLEEGDWSLYSLVSDPPPPEMTRMHALRSVSPGALVIDTGIAAIIGMLGDPWVRRASEKGVTLVNVGNGHTLCATLRGQEIGGLFEHHTFGLGREKLLRYIRMLEEGTLEGRMIFDEGGHGAVVNRPIRTEGIAATGPNRALLLPDAYPAAPYGDMMLTGCFGLMEVWKRVRGEIP